MQGQAGSAEASQQMVAADTLGRTQQLIGVEVSCDDGNEFGPALSPDAVGDEQRGEDGHATEHELAVCGARESESSHHRKLRQTWARFAAEVRR